MVDEKAAPRTPERPVFYPDHVVAQIKAFFRGIRDLSDFYYKLALLHSLCQECDGRGYLDTPDHACPHCQASGSSDVWHRAKIASRKREHPASP
ncbi:MAG: hypothetical protein NZ578_09990 [Candidatus Binatia bacterium]|nr:hypothetical protein [Candidatus Binatia bacterium]